MPPQLGGTGSLGTTPLGGVPDTGEVTVSPPSPSLAVVGVSASAIHDIGLVAIRKGPSGAWLDVTPYLHDAEKTASFSFSDERERARFERVVGDIHLELSNMDGYIETLFSTLKVSSKWFVNVCNEAGDSIFRGVIEPKTVKPNLQNLWYAFDAFSTSRLLWDVVKTLRVRRLSLEVGEQTFALTLAAFVQRELLDRYRLNELGIFSKIDLGDYSYRLIRDWQDAPHKNWPLLGNEGRFRDIDPELTWDELLKEMAKYYNADFWIDGGTDTFMMRRRNSQTTGRIVILDDVLIDSDVELSLVDEDMVDYVEAFLPYVPQGAIYKGKTRVHFDSIVKRNFSSLVGGTYKYIVVFYQGDTPALQSDPLEITLADTGSAYDGWQVQLQIPPGPVGTTSRELYRWSSPIIGGVYRGPLYGRYRGVLDGNLETTVTDNFGSSVLESGYNPLPSVRGAASAWMKYDEDTHLWSAVLELEGVDAPVGVTEDVRPQIQFVSPNTGELLDYDPFSAFCFFMSDMSFEQFKEQFQEMFLTRKRLVGKVRGTDYRVGDEVSQKRLPNVWGPEPLIKKVTVEPQTENAQIEVLL